VGESQCETNDTHVPTDFSAQRALRLLLHSVNGNALHRCKPIQPCGESSVDAGWIQLTKPNVLTGFAMT
jgi:hypothetical protein